jgi:hypothetical protein
MKESLSFDFTHLSTIVRSSASGMKSYPIPSTYKITKINIIMIYILLLLLLFFLLTRYEQTVESPFARSDPSGSTPII